LVASLLRLRISHLHGRQSANVTRHVERAISALKAPTDADWLAAAALLSLEKHRDQSLPLHRSRDRGVSYCRMGQSQSGTAARSM
jgi:hypothetical protein